MDSESGWQVVSQWLSQAMRTLPVRTSAASAVAASCGLWIAMSNMQATFCFFLPDGDLQQRSGGKIRRTL
jgi:hypothetical protein